MHRRWSVLLVALLLTGCGGVEAELPSTSVGADTARPPVDATLTVLPVPTAARNPHSPTAMPAPPVPTAFPALVAGQPYVYVVDYDRTIHIVDPRRATVVHEVPVGAAALPVFSPDGSRLYVTHHGAPPGRPGAQLDIFEVTTGRRLAVVEGLEVMAYKIWGPPIIAPARDGRTVYLHGRRITSQPGATGQDTCWIYTVDVSANRLAPETIPLPTCRIAPLVLSADGRTLYSGPWLVDLTTQPATVRANPDLAERALVQSADGHWLYALDRGGSVAVWDTNARRVTRTLPGAVAGYGSSVYLQQQSLHLDRTGTRLFIATDDGDTRNHFFKRVVILESGTGEQLGVLRSDHEFQAFTVSVDGRECYLITSSAPTPGTLEVALDVWDLTSGTKRARIRSLGASGGPVLAPAPP